MDTNSHSHAEHGNEVGGHGHGDDTSGYVNPEALQRGHEEDKVDVKSIIYVPLALVATFVLAYVVVSLVINNVRAPSTEKPANPMGAKRNEAPLNERFERIDSSNPNAQVKQPRLEGLQRVQSDDTPFWHSMSPTETGNSRWFHPEDMRITSDYCKKLGLESFAWVDHKDKIIRIPVTDALKIALSMKDPKNPGSSYLAISPKPIPRDELKDSSKPSNAHYGATGSSAHHGENKKEHDPKTREHKD
jgi:hypothetical protein